MGVTCGTRVVGCDAGVTNHTTRANANSKPQHQVMTRAEAGSTTYLSMLIQGSYNFYTLPNTSESKGAAGDSNPRLPVAGLKGEELFLPRLQ